MDVLEIAHRDYRVDEISGRYVLPAQVDEFYSARPKSVVIKDLGKSVEGRNIRMVKMGSGDLKILMWSQMHGNETTTTKAVLDLIKFLSSQNPFATQLLNACSLRIIGMLNPDGAFIYTRVNANGIDLNRDALELTQPESRILRNVYDDFNPHFCFNLHDQRTIYNVGLTQVPATLSFLAPSRDINRSIDASRETSMKVIAAVNEVLQKRIPGQIGRYDDAFNANCIGDTLQMLGTPSILFEAGHYPEDYERETVREYVFYALLAALATITNGSYLDFDIRSYFEIPENNKLYFDILIRNFHLEGKTGAQEDIGILFREKLQGDQIKFEPYIEERGDLSSRFGHKTYNFSKPKDRDFLLKSPLYTLLDI